jgi:hypothetical protein
MICSLRSVFLLPVVVAVGASFCLAQTGSITRIEENDASIAYSGLWHRNISTGNSGSGAMMSNDEGARAVVTFTGTGISWIGVADPWSGLADVTIDGRPLTVNSSGAATRYQVVLFTVNGLSNGPHKLSIEVKDERGFGGHHYGIYTTPEAHKHDAPRAWVWLDAFDIHDGMGVAGGLPAATAGRIENDNPAMTYTGLWHLNASPVMSGGTAVLATGPRSTVSLTFNGTGIEWIAYRDQGSGLARVIVDGEVKETIDAFLSPAQARAVAYRIEGLQPGNHSLTIEVTGTRSESSSASWVWLDAFDVTGSTTTATQAQTPALFMGPAAEYCVGDSWSLGVSNAVPAASVRLLGATNGQSWMIPQWTATDASGSVSLAGVFGAGTQGSHTLGVEIGGKISNTIPFVISNCGR